MSSRHEGMPITAIEAMACGIPSIFYNVPGLRDFNQYGECSVLVEEDPSKLAEAILALKADQVRQQRLVSHARSYVSQAYDMPTNVRKIFELYQK